MGIEIVTEEGTELQTTVTGHPRTIPAREVQFECISCGTLVIAIKFTGPAPKRCDSCRAESRRLAAAEGMRRKRAANAASNPPRPVGRPRKAHNQATHTTTPQVAEPQPVAQVVEPAPAAPRPARQPRPAAPTPWTPNLQQQRNIIAEEQQAALNRLNDIDFFGAKPLSKSERANLLKLIQKQGADLQELDQQITAQSSTAPTRRGKRGNGQA